MNEQWTRHIGQAVSNSWVNQRSEAKSRFKDRF